MSRLLAVTIALALGGCSAISPPTPHVGYRRVEVRAMSAGDRMRLQRDAGELARAANQVTFGPQRAPAAVNGAM